MSKVSVVVTVLNESSNIEKLIKALFDQTKKPDEVIIVDGGSSDATRDKVYSLQTTDYSKKGLRVFVKKGNRSVGRNYGISRATSSIIAVTDAGCYPKKDWLERITQPFVKKSTQVVSGYYLGKPRTSFEKSITPYFLVMPDRAKDNQEFLPSSRSIAFRKSIWKKVGGYPKKFSHNEDLVFDYNLKKMGVKFVFEKRAIVYWQPPRTLRSATKQFFRFALGDAEARVERPKIKFIFLRYATVILLICLQAYILLASYSIFYILYSIFKNYKYVNRKGGLSWLPVIQIVSDIAVMSGHICGMIKYALSSSANKK